MMRGRISFLVVLLFALLSLAMPAASWAQGPPDPCDTCCQPCETGMCLDPPPCGKDEPGDQAAPIPEPTAALLFLAGVGVITYTYTRQRRRRS